MILNNKRGSLYLCFNDYANLDKIYLAKVASNGSDFYSITSGTTVAPGPSITVGSSSFVLTSTGLVSASESYLTTSNTVGDTLSATLSNSLDPLT